MTDEEHAAVSIAVRQATIEKMWEHVAGLLDAGDRPTDETAREYCHRVIANQVASRPFFRPCLRNSQQPGWTDQEGLVACAVTWGRAGWVVRIFESFDTYEKNQQHAADWVEMAGRVPLPLAAPLLELLEELARMQRHGELSDEVAQLCITIRGLLSGPAPLPR